jgi:hypothetical protein
MSGTKIWLSGLAVALLGVGVVRGQGADVPGGKPEPLPPPTTMSGPGPSAAPLPSGPPPQGAPLPPSQFRLSKWIVGERWPGCCGPIGCNGPIGSEMYLRTGISFPLGSGGLSGASDTGWDIEGGGRVLFFNREVDAAWTVDLGITYIFNPSSSNNGPFTLFNVPVQTVAITGQQTTVNIPSIDVTVRNVNRTFVNLSGGREWWLLGTADSSHNDFNWRVGFDVGGRWGTEKVELNELKHRNDIISGLFVSAHTDVEVPCGSAILQAGIRLEYGYTWGDVLQHQNNGDTQDLNLTFMLGMRF